VRGLVVRPDTPPHLGFVALQRRSGRALLLGSTPPLRLQRRSLLADTSHLSIARVQYRAPRSEVRFEVSQSALPSITLSCCPLQHSAVVCELSLRRLQLGCSLVDLSLHSRERTYSRRIKSCLHPYSTRTHLHGLLVALPGRPSGRHLFPEVSTVGLQGLCCGPAAGLPVADGVENGARAAALASSRSCRNGRLHAGSASIYARHLGRGG